jgi:arylformamidase
MDGSSRGGAQRPIIDISPPLTPDLGVWPGDVPLEREPALDMERGDPVSLSAMRATVHLGAHADAPSHTRRGSRSIGECDLLPYIGPCQVLRIAAPRGSRIGRKDLPAAIEAPRVLLATGTFPDPLRWNQDFAAPGPDLIDELHARGAILLGVDTPSVDLFDSEDLPSHHTAVDLGIAILEGLVLAGVPEGLYELSALPLRLMGFDGSPVRAVLRPM